jgi:hypothetical protein
MSPSRTPRPGYGIGLKKIEPGWVSSQCTPGKKGSKHCDCSSLKCDCACHKSEAPK